MENNDIKICEIEKKKIMNIELITPFSLKIGTFKLNNIIKFII